MKYLKLKNSDEKIPVGKMIGVGRNYAKHALELGNEVPKFPIIFLMPASVLVFDGDEIIYPEGSTDMHHEVELVLLIGKEVKNATKEEAEEAIAGYGVGLDMTLRTLQNELRKNGDPWTLAKVFDTSAVVSDIILKKDYMLKGNEEIKLTINGEVRQHSSIENMIFDSVKIVEYLSSKFTLEKGDLIFTGTPEGVSAVNKGDILVCDLENIGTLTTKIV